MSQRNIEIAIVYIYATTIPKKLRKLICETYCHFRSILLTNTNILNWLICLWCLKF